MNRRTFLESASAALSCLPWVGGLFKRDVKPSVAVPPSPMMTTLNFDFAATKDDQVYSVWLWKKGDDGMWTPELLSEWSGEQRLVIERPGRICFAQQANELL